MKKTSKLAIGVIIIGILLLGIGYAAIQNITLYIKGTVTADPSQANFKVRFTEVKEVSDESKVTAEITDELNATIDVEGLTTVDETVFATYEIKNESENLSSNLTMTTTNDNEEYFEIQSELEKTSVVAGETTTVTITVKLIKEPTESESATVNVEITAIPVQPGENAELENHPTEEITTLASVTNYNIGEYMDLGNDIVDYNGTTGVTTDDWRVLYVDEDNETVYVILSSYLPNTYLSSIDGLTIEGTYGVTSNSGSTLVGILKNDGYYMLDYWENFAKGINGAKVTGTPTAELLMKSYNEKNGTNLVYTNYPTLDCSGTNNLYMPHYSSEYEEYEGCCGYWLTNQASNTNVWNVYVDGSINNQTCDMGGYSTRPVISLPFNTSATKVNGIWKVTNN